MSRTEPPSYPYSAKTDVAALMSAARVVSVERDATRA
jgi:hypothetical protein